VVIKSSDWTQMIDEIYLKINRLAQPGFDSWIDDHIIPRLCLSFQSKDQLLSKTKKLKISSINSSKVQKMFFLDTNQIKSYYSSKSSRCRGMIKITANSIWDRRFEEPYFNQVILRWNTSFTICLLLRKVKKMLIELMRKHIK
jgi:hypothetical protein